MEGTFGTDKPVSRRKILGAFGIAGLTAASGSAFATSAPKYLPAVPADKLAEAQSINYKMFGAKGDGKNDDSIQIKAAHDYANKMNLPIVNPAGEYWLKQANNIEIMTNVDWGNTIFHINEKNNTAGGRFSIVSRTAKRTIELDTAQKSSFLKQLKPGVAVIPEMAGYNNCLVLVADKNDQIGFRSGAQYSGQAWAREELFYVEEHGRILGDIAWTFKDYTSLIAYPAETSYLTVNGGTFYLSGDSPGTRYVKNGFSITRSRTIIQNQWVGLEPGAVDGSMSPRSGFYGCNSVYDVKLENIRLIPYEQDREGTDRDVSAGTYGIGAVRVLNLLLRNVTAEGGPVHWGVFGTNLNKNLRIENCRLNRVDVHFHCWNLHIKDSNIGYRGVSVTGGGDLIIENTSCYNRSFINFRRDFGAKWDGHIRLHNCRFIPSTLGESSIFDFNPADFSYKYPLGFGRSIIVENLIIDYSASPSATKPCWLMALPAFSKTTTGDRLFFPNYVEFRNVMVVGRQQGVRLLKIADPRTYHVGKQGGYDGVFFTANSRIVFDHVQLEDLEMSAKEAIDPVHISIGGNTDQKYEDEFALYPEISIMNCKSVKAHFGSNSADVRFEQSSLAGVLGSEKGTMPGRFTFSSCLFQPAGKEGSSSFYRLASALGTSLTNCTLHAPKIDGVSKPELAEAIGFVVLNKKVQFNHLNTQLGNDILNYCRSKNIAFKPRFVEMLKSHHQLESDSV